MSFEDRAKILQAIAISSEFGVRELSLTAKNEKLKCYLSFEMHGNRKG